MTQERIDAARKRIEEAYEQVTDIYREYPCKEHYPEQTRVFTP
jgi:hypothetical protein